MGEGGGEEKVKVDHGRLGEKEPGEEKGEGERPREERKGDR